VDAPGGPVWVYRAVDAEERMSIVRNGRFELSPNGAETKSFVALLTDAQALAAVYAARFGRPHWIARGHVQALDDVEPYTFADVPGQPMQAMAFRGQALLNRITDAQVMPNDD